MKVDGPWRSAPGTQALLAVLTEAGHQALFVGGCVRNALLGRPVQDVDLATDAAPQTVSDLAENAGFRTIPTGIDHGTVTVIAAGIAHEVTTFRRDVTTDGRHATVAFTTQLTDDAARRDFTINALYAMADGTVVDPLGGLPDVLARRVRFVGDAAERIAEDYLRILRFFRFHAYYADPAQGIDAEGLAACAANLSGLASLSRERVGAEIRKLLSAPDPAPAVASMAQAGVLTALLPGADAHTLPVLIHLEAGEPTAWLTRLAALGGEDVPDRLRLSRAEASLLGDIRDEIGSLSSPAVLGWHLPDAARDVLLLRAAVIGTPPPPNWQTEVARGRSAVFPVTASDLMPALQGPALGAQLKALQQRWLASDLRLGRAELLG